jgi:hypothetical protein
VNPIQRQTKHHTRIDLTGFVLPDVTRAFLHPVENLDESSSCMCTGKTLINASQVKLNAPMHSPVAMWFRENRLHTRMYNANAP